MTTRVHDTMFVSRQAKLAFCLLRNKRGDLDADLGITNKHYLFADSADVWRDTMLAEFQDSLITGEEMNQVIDAILLTHKRMTGHA